MPEPEIGVTALLAAVHRLEQRSAELESEVRSLKAAKEAVGPILETLQRWQCRSELKAYLASRRFTKTVSPGRPPTAEPFTIELICADASDAAALTRPDLFLDDPTLAAHYGRPYGRLGAIKINRTEWFITTLAHRLSERLARRFADRLELPADLLSEAWFGSVWAELWPLIAARRLARRLAPLCGGDPVLIPLKTMTFPYLSHGADGIDLFYLGAELRRRGATVAFVCTDPDVVDSARTKGAVTLRFEPAREKWVHPALPEAPVLPSPTGRPALVGSGIRGIAHILKEIPNPLKFQSTVVIDRSFGSADEAVIDARHLPVSLVFSLRRDAQDGVTSPAAVCLSTTLPHSDLGEYLFTILGGATRAAVDRALGLVERHRLTEAHICDHPFFESAIIAHAVRVNGGKVITWPHGTNPAFPFVRPPDAIDSINCALAPAAEYWRLRSPGIPVAVIPNLWLPKYREPRAPVESEPLTVVIICNECNYGRLVVMDRRETEQTYRRLSRAFAEMGTQVRPVWRPRSPENLQWIWQLLGQPADFAYAADTPMFIDMPNMVFLFAGQLSSGLFEGIGRGIPGLYLREDPTVEDYLAIDLPPCLPTGRIEVIMREVDRCRDAAYRQALTERQVAWYEGLTAEGVSPAS